MRHNLKHGYYCVRLPDDEERRRTLTRADSLMAVTDFFEEESIKPLAPGELSQVPYAEPTWLSEGHYSPYYSDSHRKFQKAVHAFCMEVIQPESDRCEQVDQRISQEVVDKMA